MNLSSPVEKKHRKHDPPSPPRSFNWAITRSQLIFRPSERRLIERGAEGRGASLYFQAERGAATLTVEPGNGDGLEKGRAEERDARRVRVEQVEHVNAALKSFHRASIERRLIRYGRDQRCEMEDSVNWEKARNRVTSKTTQRPHLSELLLARWRRTNRLRQMVTYRRDVDHPHRERDRYDRKREDLPRVPPLPEERAELVHEAGDDALEAAHLRARSRWWGG